MNKLTRKQIREIEEYTSTKVINERSDFGYAFIDNVYEYEIIGETMVKRNRWNMEVKKISPRIQKGLLEIIRGEND